MALQPREHPLVSTSQGSVRGVSEDGLAVFRGVPYAAPPIGDLRWRAPVPCEPWGDTLDASGFGPACAQTPDEHEIKPGTPQSEDCLTLNIWTPAVDAAPRPVLVWIHGGAFSWGTARNDLYDGGTLARRCDLVVVSIQYRLGAFGWLDLSEIGGEVTSGNNGLLDQIAALGWIHDHIADFGGDPGAVTVAGESAGAISIGALLASSRAAGLFHRAILQSGSPSLVALPEWSEGVTREFLTAAGVDDLEGLHSLSTDDVLSAQTKLFESQFSDTAFHPVVDGHVLEAAPMHTLNKAAAVTDVPILIGTTLDEIRLWLYYFDYLDRLPLSYLKPWLDEISGGRSAEVIAAYRRSRPAHNDPQRGLAIAGDAAFRMPAIRLAELLAARGTPVWMYLFTLESKLLDGRMGSPHAMDLPFMFHNLESDGASDFLAEERAHPDYVRLAEVMQDSWAAFARGGDPRTEALSDWPPYEGESRPTMMFDLDCGLQNDPYPEERLAWAGVPFDGVTPSLRDVSPQTFPGTKTSLAAVLAVAGPRKLAAGITALLAGAIGVWRLRQAARQSY